MFSIDVFSRIPVYEQIIRQAEDYVSKGLLKAGDKIPSVRNLSVTLSVNPNTIQKAYSELDLRGIIFSVPGKGCFVTENAQEIVNKSKRKKLEELSSLVNELKIAGTEYKDIQAIIDSIYNNKEE
ncbi:MAG: GntR family transcriptional regulator [Clostridia bacterium]|nr:GntR family transcriptional regulator [Clostridia bacterium]